MGVGVIVVVEMDEETRREDEEMGSILDLGGGTG